MSETSVTPAAKPEIDYIELLKQSWEAFTRNPLELIVGPFLASLTSLLLVTIGAVSTGLSAVGLKSARGESVTIGDSFSGYSRFVTSLLAALFGGLIIVVGFVLLVIPGIIASLLLIWTFYFLADDPECGSIDALKASYNLAKENFVVVLISVIILIVLNFIGQLLVIGFLVTTPLSLIYLALVYDRLRGRAA